MRHKFEIKESLFSLAFALLLVACCESSLYAAPARFPKLFGFNEIDQKELNYLPQWLSVMQRHIEEDADLSVLKIKSWLTFLDSIKTLPPIEQVEQVNSYANQLDYIIDLQNYGEEDYWAIVKEFLSNFGDCEDFSITKFFSLRYLGFSKDSVRLVILQDTNLKVAHAVLAVAIDGDVLILDNQSKNVVSHKDIVHYSPLYSVNEEQWWLHLPPAL